MIFEPTWRFCIEKEWVFPITEVCLWSTTWYINDVFTDSKSGFSVTEFSSNSSSSLPYTRIKRCLNDVFTDGKAGYSVDELSSNSSISLRYRHIKRYMNYALLIGNGGFQFLNYIPIPVFYCPCSITSCITGWLYLPIENGGFQLFASRLRIFQWNVSCCGVFLIQDMNLIQWKVLFLWKTKKKVFCTK